MTPIHKSSRKKKRVSLFFPLVTAVGKWRKVLELRAVIESSALMESSLTKCYNLDGIP